MVEHGLMTLSVLVTRSAGPSVLVAPGDFFIYKSIDIGKKIRKLLTFYFTLRKLRSII